VEFERINYPDLFDHFQLTNPNSYGDRFPVDFMSVALPLDAINVTPAVEPRQVIWIRASKSRGQALLVEDSRSRIAYLPIAGLKMRDGRYAIERDPRDEDPFQYGPAARNQVYTESEWAGFTRDTPHASLPVILADLFRENYLPFLQSPELGRLYPMLAPAELDALKAALLYRFRRGNPDFRVWLSRGWNANPNLPTPTGAHGGFAPIVANLVFSVWGGPSTRLKRGETIDSDYYSGDIASTLLNAIGRLSGEGPLPSGRIIPILEEGNEP
jgi:hypothetical protein